MSDIGEAEVALDGFPVKHDTFGRSEQNREEMSANAQRLYAKTDTHSLSISGTESSRRMTAELADCPLEISGTMTNCEGKEKQKRSVHMAALSGRTRGETYHSAGLDC